MSNNFTKLTLKKVTLKKVAKVLIELDKGGMTVFNACKKHEISRPTFYKWVNHSQENTNKFYNILDSRTIEVEDSLYKEALEGNTTAQIFWLKNRGRQRWSDKQEIEHSGTGLTINVSNDAAKEGLNDVLGNVQTDDKTK